MVRRVASRLHRRLLDVQLAVTQKPLERSRVARVGIGSERGAQPRKRLDELSVKLQASQRLAHWRTSLTACASNESSLRARFVRSCSVSAAATTWREATATSGVRLLLGLHAEGGASRAGACACRCVRLR